LVVFYSRRLPAAKVALENALAKLLVTTWSKVKLTIREAAHYRHYGVNGAAVSFFEK